MLSLGTLRTQTIGSIVLSAVLLSTHFAVFPSSREFLQVMSLSESLAPGGPSIADPASPGSVSSFLKCPLVLKTSDQYDLWRSRVGDTCWAATMKDIWSLNEGECERALGELTHPDQKTPHVHAWVGKCWSIITSSLHDDVYRKVSHIPRGKIPSLLAEIAFALQRDGAEEVAPLRLQLYGATMTKDAGNDLQLWISYLIERRDKLHFLKKPIEDAELVVLFLKGLPAVFQQLKVYFAIPNQLPRNFDAAITAVRKFASDPAVEMELNKLKSSGVSQTMFHMQATPPAHQSTSRQRCIQFARNGSCRFGTRCKFSHTVLPGTGNSNATQFTVCTFCSKPGHGEVDCHFKKKLLSQLQQPKPTTLVVAATQPSDTPAQQEGKATPQAIDYGVFNFVFSVGTSEESDTTRDSRWVLDSGATCCATFDESDCTDVRECSVHVTAAGTKFLVEKVGTAKVVALDAKGREIHLNLTNTLISTKFPYKLLALQLVTSKGHKVEMGMNEMRITNRLTDHVLLGVKDPRSKLFFLSTTTKSTNLIARAYSDDTDGTGNALWKLHLRHGHRNFADIARQYNLPVPKVMPACRVASWPSHMCTHI